MFSFFSNTRSSYLLLSINRHFANKVSILLNFCPLVTTLVVCSSRLLIFLGSRYCKHYGTRSNCSQGSSLIRVYIVHIGQRSAVGNVSGDRCEIDCRSRGHKFNPGPVPYFRGD